MDEQKQRLIALLRQGPMQAIQYPVKKNNLGDFVTMQKMGETMNNINWNGYQMPSNNVDAMNSAITPNLQNAGQFQQITPQQAAVSPQFQSMQNQFMQDPGIMSKFFGGF